MGQLQRVQIKDSAILFGNLSAPSEVIGEKSPVKARIPTPSAAVARPNARGALRAVENMQEAADLGFAAATRFLERYQVSAS